MKFKTTKQDFQKTITRVIGVVSARASLPILSNILLETEGKDTIRVIGTDLELGISTTMDATVEGEGSITVPAKKLHDILREISDTDIRFVAGKNHNITITAGKGEFKIMGTPKDDFPKLPSEKSGAAVEIDQPTLKECVGLTSFAASHDQTRYVLNGTLFIITNNELRLITTDGRRLSFVRRKLASGQQEPLEVIIPTKTINELNRLLGEAGVVRVIPMSNQIAFEVGETKLISRLIDGKFPNYEQVIPKGEKTKITIDREALLSAVKRAALLTSPDAQAVKLDVLADKILISSRTPNLGESQEELAAKLSGEEIAIGFNPQYLIDVLKNLNDEEVFLHLTEADKSGILRGASDDYLYVVMPMQLA